MSILGRRNRDAQPRQGLDALRRPRPVRKGLALAAIATLLPWPSVAMLGAGVAQAASASGASFSGGAGTRVVNGNLYADPGAAVTLNVTTDTTTRCVEITGAHTATKTGENGTTQWSFPLKANATNGIHSITATAYRNFNNNNNNNKCTANAGEGLGTQTASYFVESDSTAPVVTGAVSPAANAAGWHKSDVAIAWSATDVGSGVAAGYPSPATSTVTADTTPAGVTRTSTAMDNAGNSGSGSVTVRRDTVKPVVTASADRDANAAGWHNSDVTVSFSATDALSGIDKQPAAKVLGEGANQSASGTAADLAGNEATATLSGVNVDKTNPTLSASVASSPNAAGWHNAPVTVKWNAADALSGLAGTAPADTLLGEGADQVVTKSVVDKAGNSTTASSPTINVDTTAPNTGATAPTGWKNTTQTITLDPHDSLSGVAATYYILDDTAAKSGTSVAITGDGTHTLEFWSVDKAGNAEARKTVEVKVDGSAPTISSSLSPAPNAAGWNNSNVTVAFKCDDTVSGIASCTPDQLVSEEGKGRIVEGTATDNANNTVTAQATVSLDKTAPTVTGSKDHAANAAGWHKGDVTVSFKAEDALSGVDTVSGATKLGEGENQSVKGTATDAAGNTASDTIADIDIDKTAPSLSGAATTAPNAAGWHKGDVTVKWTASDALSGLTGAPADDTLTGEGDALSASATVVDQAGNETTKTVGAIKIDRTAPTTTVDVTKLPESGWYTGEVSVALHSADGLSSVDKTYYAVDGGTPQEYNGGFTHGLNGTHTIAYWSVDLAGNVEKANSVEVRIDSVKPTISGSRSPAGNEFGWNNSDVVVTFKCDDAHSGIADCSPVTTELKNEDADQSVTGNAKDVAGNKASATVDGINIDKTAPTLSGAATAPANAAGWYKGDVTVKWTAGDSRSGVNPATEPKDSVVTGEGTNLSTEHVTVADKAGNVTGASKAGFNIDRTAPTVDGKPTTAPNADGWYNSAVTVGFSCADTLSGVAQCPSNKVLATDGKNQSVTSGTAEDEAGNVSEPKTVGGINIDGAAPQTTAEEQCDKVNGYCKGAKANVLLTATDGLSGVKEVRYSVNGAAERSVAGNVANAEVVLNRSGKATVTYYAVDMAGNVEAKGIVTVKYDNLAPTMTHTLSPAPNAADWNNSDVTVTFNAKDETEGSGVDTAKTTPPQTITAETAGFLVTGEAFDLAENRGADSVLVKLDKTRPTIAAVASGQQGANGWYTGEVTVRYTCSDALSGVAVCPKDQVINSNGLNQSVSGTAIDAAGNEATATVSGINIDAEKPGISFGQSEQSYTLGAVPAQTCTATDTGSGPASCEVKVTGGTVNGVGTFVATATATDKAGNVQTASRTFKVLYKWEGFRQPINDTAHQIGTSTSIFKAGSTIPAKFVLKKADGTVVQAATAPAWITPVKGAATSAPVDESLYTDPVTSGSLYRWDGAQYIYNWGTTKTQVGNYWRIGVQLDDGQVYHVNIGLR